MANSTSRKPLAVLALAVVAYALAAWAVTPGFYDGIAPVQPYRWVSPPAQFRASNQPPLSGHSTFKVGTGGLVNPGSASTEDGQASFSFQQGALTPPAGAAPVTIDIAPRTAAAPNPGSVHMATNVYCITSTSPLAPGKEAIVTLQFSAQLTAPSDVYRFQEGGTWQKIGNAGASAPYFIAARTTALGCFAAGYVPSAKSTGPGISLPIVAALALGVVVLAGIPLMVLRRRGQEEEED